MQHILNRTNTPNLLPPKKRSGAAEEDNVESETGASAATTQNSSEPSIVRYDSAGVGSKDKRYMPNSLPSALAS